MTLEWFFFLSVQLNYFWSRRCPNGPRISTLFYKLTRFEGSALLWNSRVNLNRNFDRIRSPATECHIPEKFATNGFNWKRDRIRATRDSRKRICSNFFKGRPKESRPWRNNPYQFVVLRFIHMLKNLAQDFNKWPKMLFLPHSVTLNWIILLNWVILTQI